MTAKNIFALLAVFIIAIYLNGCTSSRMFSGEPKYNDDGKKVGGDNLTWYEYVNHTSDREKLSDAREEREEGDTEELPFKNKYSEYLGWFVNKTNYDVDIKIYDENNHLINSFSGLAHWHSEIYLNPGTYTVMFNGGKNGTNIMTVEAVKKTMCPIRENNKVKKLKGYFYIKYDYENR